MGILGIVVLAVTAYLFFIWTGQAWLLWMLVGVTAIIAQINNNIWFTRLCTPNRRDSPTLRGLKEVFQQRFSGAKKPLSQKLAEPAGTFVIVACFAWLGHAYSWGVWLQCGLDILMWFAVVIGVINGFRLRMVERKIA